MDTLNSLGKKLRLLIESAADNGTLQNAPFYWDIMTAWKYLGGAQKAKAWMSAGVTESAGFLAKATSGLVGYSISTPRRIYSMRERPDGDLYDLPVLLKACEKHLDGQELNEDQRNRVAVVAQALERMIKGALQASDTPN
jgi:hypothetical protein